MMSPATSQVRTGNEEAREHDSKAGTLWTAATIAVVAFLSLLFSVCMPPLQINDEGGHFVRAFEISAGVVRGDTGTRLPAGLLRFVDSYPEELEAARKVTARGLVQETFAGEAADGPQWVPIRDGIHHNRYFLRSLLGADIYSPIVYLPASAGIALGRLVHASPLLLLYMARWMNILVVVAGLWAAFRLAPEYRALFAVLALVPMSLQQAGGVSADPLLIALAFVACALVLRAREHPVTRSYLAATGAVFVALASCKSAFWALPLVWLIPAAAFRSRLRRVFYVGAVAAGMLIPLLGWQLWDKANFDAARLERLAEGVDMAGNARFIASHPLQYSALLAKTIALHALGYANQFLSAFGPWRSHHAPIGIMLLYAVLIIGVALVRPAVKPFGAAERVILAATLGIAVIGIHVFLFIGEANPKLPDGLLNVGVQGRYFLPCAPAALLLLGQRRLNFSPDTLLKIIVPVAVVSALAAQGAIYSVFYA